MTQLFKHYQKTPCEDPRVYGRALTGGDLNGFWRYRVGDYRIIATIEAQAFVVLVVKIGHRKQVYD